MTMVSRIVDDVFRLVFDFLARAIARRVKSVLLRFAKGCGLMALILQKVAGAGCRGGLGTEAD